MQFLQDFLNSKRLPIKDILSQYLQISIKIDGSAFQTYCDENNKIHYGKRYDKNVKQSSKEITIFDLLTTPIYYHAYTYLKQYENLIKQYKILNFEILDNNHIISYNNEYKNNIVLLSGFNYDDTEIDYNTLKSLSDELNISVKQNVYEGHLMPTEIEYIINNKNNLDVLYKFFSDITYINNSSDIEGFVLNLGFNNRVLKLLNPIFREQQLNHFNEEKNYKEENYEDCYNFVINNIDINTLDLNQEYINILFNIYQNLEKTKECKKFDLIQKNNLSLQCQTINKILLQKIYKHDILYENILKFILLGFRTKRIKKPLWCSLEYQKNILNNFIDKIKLK